MKNLSWKILLQKEPKAVYDMLNTDKGRASFWAESAIEDQNSIQFIFINGQKTISPILDRSPHQLFKINYFGVETSFYLQPLNENKTVVQLECVDIPESEYEEILPGWVSVLMNLKAVLEHGIDLRNHDPQHCWDQRFVNN